MNILFLCDEYPPCKHGGIGTVYQLLARTLVYKGHKVWVAGFYPYSRKSLKEENDNGVKVFRYFYGSGFRLHLSQHHLFGRVFNISTEFNRYTSFIKKLIVENEIQIIESPDFVDAFIYSGPRVIRFPDFGIPLIIKLHGSFSVLMDQNHMEISNTKTIKKKEQFFLNSAKGLLAVSESVVQRTNKIYEFSKKPDVLYNGIVLYKNTYKTHINSAKVVFVGKLLMFKGIYSLVKAWKMVVEAVPFARLELYGNGDDNSIMEIQKIIKKYPADSVILKGFIQKEKLPEIYINAACAVFPSYQEAFSMAPMEAMAVGCPVIFTKRTSGPELITNGKDGLLVDPDDIAEIANAIIYLLKNRDKAVEIGRKGYERIRDNFEISIVTENHLKYYRSILKTS